MKNKIKVILHMPHVSLKLPKYFYKGLLITKEEFNKYNLKMSDVGVDTLFSHLKGKRIIPKYSRLFCDVERFRNDEYEIMSKVGQGVVYTHTYDGVNFHLHDEKYKNKVLKYYDKYHRKLDKIAKKYFKKRRTLLILDLHSFSEEQASKIKDGPYPDICIGVEKEYYDQEILDMVIDKIKEKKYTYLINHPYAGSLVPNVVYNKQVHGKVVSIMIEVNKKIYL